jgi:hypothetical protein
MDAAAEFWVAGSDKKDAAFATESLRSLFELFLILFKNDKKPGCSFLPKTWLKLSLSECRPCTCTRLRS